MIIKKFVGKTEAEAVEAAKKELGDGVVIMNVKDVQRKGLAALFRAKQTEVTVALEEENDTVVPVRRETPSPAARKEQPRPVKRLSADNSAEADLSHEIVLGTEDRIAIEKKLDSLESLLMSRFQQNEAAREETTVSEKAAEEENREEPQQEEMTQQQRFVRLLYNTMLESEVDEKYANQIVNEVDVSGKSNLPIDYILENIYQKMILKFGQPHGIDLTGVKPKVVFFVGPTGVGKTTTLAKIASRLKVDQGKKIAFLTADTYRIAAAEQLRIYANILDTSLSIIYSAEELNHGMEQLEEVDVVLVDTAGFSHKSQTLKEDVKNLIQSLDARYSRETYLVLSATTKYNDLKEIADIYKEISDYKIIFTKLDETTTYGNILNIKLYSNAEVSYITNGQNVPDDIEIFNSQKIVKRLLGGS